MLRTCPGVAELIRSLRDGRFLSAALVVNFVVVPLVVAAMFAFLPANRELCGADARSS
ncbi:hypothetical protein [Streptomyces sp. NPDC059744]|uniref:hypothetical protein n=1 Tax=Streptomyces sp. NPDC059744 TaxID=3346929 RepID=UPI003656FB50